MSKRFKLKIGDRVLISKPSNTNERPYWGNSMNKYHNTIQKIEGIYDKYIEIDSWDFSPKWLTKIKKSITVNRIQLASLIGLDPCKEFNSVINSLLVTQSGKNIKLKKDVLIRYKECKTYHKYLLKKIGITEVLVTATLEYISEKETADFSILNDTDVFYLHDGSYGQGWLFKGKDPFNTKVKGVDIEEKTKFKNTICSKKEVTILRKATSSENELYNNIYCPYKKGDLIFVKWKFTVSWELRYFSHIEKDRVFCFNAQKKDGSTTCWDYHAPAIGVKLPK